MFSYLRGRGKYIIYWYYDGLFRSLKNKKKAVKKLIALMREFI